MLTVGASESDRPPTASSCASALSAPQNLCWDAFFPGIASPFSSDFISNNISGMAAFSSRGPTDDGRIKPEIVAPGTNILSTRSHASGASYQFTYNANYAYDSGTSMATPMVSGAAALVRQWLDHDRGISTPSAALVKALLLNGAVNLGPGQYGTGSTREIPAAWPNNVEGWGRMDVAKAVQLDDAQIGVTDSTAGLSTGGSASYTLHVSAQQPLQITLAWTDYPALPFTLKALVNDLDLEVQAPDGSIVRGNASADLSSTCRVNGADRCNNVESVTIATPQIGDYTMRVSGTTVVHGPQPYALVSRLEAPPLVAPQDAPTLDQPVVNGALLSLSWTPVATATRYEVQASPDASFTSVRASTQVTDASLPLLLDIGSYMLRVRACNSAGCGPYSNSAEATIDAAPQKRFTPLITGP